MSPEPFFVTFFSFFPFITRQRFVFLGVSGSDKQGSMMIHRPSGACRLSTDGQLFLALVHSIASGLLHAVDDIDSTVP